MGRISLSTRILYTIFGREYIQAYILDQCRKPIWKVNLSIDTEEFIEKDRLYLVDLNDAVKIKNKWTVFYDLHSLRNKRKIEKGADKEGKMSNLSFVDHNDKINSDDLYDSISIDLLSAIVKKSDIWTYLPTIMSVLVLIVLILMWLS